MRHCTCAIQIPRAISIGPVPHVVVSARLTLEIVKMPRDARDRGRAVSVRA